MLSGVFWSFTPIRVNRAVGCVDIKDDVAGAERFVGLVLSWVGRTIGRGRVLCHPAISYILWKSRW